MVDSVVTDEILDRLKKTESSGDALALHPKTKALGAYQFMPETAVMLHKKGIEFNPFNEKESRQAAKQYLEMLVKQNNGDLDKALKQYGGFKEQDPTSYISKVTGSKPSSAPKDQFDLLGGATEQTQTKNVEKTPSSKLDQFELLTAQPEQTKTQQQVVSKQPEVAQTTAQPAAQTTTQPIGVVDQAKQAITKNLSLQKMFEAKQALGQGFGERVAGAIDTAYGGIVPAAYGAVVQGLARTVNTPQKAEQIGQAAASSIDQPIGKALGITGKETYQHPLGSVGTKISEEINHLFNVLHLTPEQISETVKSKFGVTLPPEDIRNMVVIGSAAIPQALKEIKPAVGQITKPITKALGELEITTPAQQLQAQFEAKQGKATAGSVGSAASQNNPYAGKFTGEETARDGQFAQIKLSKTPKDVPVSEQALRSQAIQEVMPDLPVRQGVIKGNENLLRDEHTKSKLDTPEGRLYKEQIANEQIALSKFAEDRIHATGASRTLINDEQRGGRINDVMYGVDPEEASSASIMGYLNQAKKEIYDSAFKNVGNNKIATSNTDSFFSNPQQLATAEKDGTLGFLNGAKKELELAKTVGFELPDGKIAPPGSVAAFDAVRKSNNAPGTWTPERANTIRKINQAIDKDIAQVADPSLYKLGDSIHKAEKNIFSSKGINTIFGKIDQNGVLQSKTPIDKIPSTLNNLPPDQWRHIRSTLEDLANGRIRGVPEGMPPVSQELMQSARAAVAEIDGALAREVYEKGAGKAGVWNQNSANTIMNSRVGEKILETFPPDEIRKYHLLNTVGQLVPGIHSYEGAALQKRRLNLIEAHGEKIGKTLGAGAGAVMGELQGAAIGGYLGGKIGEKASERSTISALNKQAQKAQKEMKKAQELGKNTLNDIKNTK